MTTAFWAPRSPWRAMVVLTLAVAATSPLFTSLGSPNLPGRAPYGPVACGAALAALQLRTSNAAARGERPRWPWPTLLVMAVLVYVPAFWYAQNWWATQAMLGASALMLVRQRRLAITLAAAPVVATLALFGQDWLYYGTGVLFIYLAFWGVGLTAGIAALYGAAWLVRVVGELREARTELAELAITQERLRVSRDLHDLAGQSLTAISLRGDLALALLDQDRTAARAEMATLVATARGALHDVLTVTRNGTEVDLGVTNVLRRCEASTCTITASAARLEIVNDGVRPGQAGTGHGLAGLAKRARVFSGSVTAGQTGDGQFRLLVEFT